MTQLTDALFLFGELSLIVLCGYYAHEGIAGDQHMGEISYPCSAWEAMIDAALKSTPPAGST